MTMEQLFLQNQVVQVNDKVFEKDIISQSVEPLDAFKEKIL